MVKRGAYWHDSGNSPIVAESSSHKLEGNEDMVRVLAKKGLTMDLGVDNGYPLFMLTFLKYGDTEECTAMSMLLLELGVKYDPQNLLWHTPLIRAVIGFDDLDVRRLLHAGRAVNEKNELGRDALTYAALARHEAVVEPLLKAGADVHSSDVDGMTALSAACKGGNKRIVKLLLDSGADISAQDKFGRTAIDIATESGNAPLLRLLRDHGTDDYAGDEDTKPKMDKAEFDAGLNAAWDFFEAQPDIRSSDNRFIAAIRRQTIRRGYDKTVPVLLDAYVKEKERENDPAFVEEQEAGSSESDVMTRRVHRAYRAAEKELNRHRRSPSI